MQKGGAGHRWTKGQLSPVTEEVKKIWVQMGLGMSVWLWEGKSTSVSDSFVLSVK